MRKLTLVFLLLTIFINAQVYTSWYSLSGKKTASGEIFNNNVMTCAASPKFKFGTKIQITNLANGKTVIVKVTDRGQFYKSNRKHLFDLSKGAFKKIESFSSGKIRVKYKIL